MPNIFSGLKKLSDDDIRLQIALFESVTVGNALKETGFKAVGKLLTFSQSFIGISDKNSKAVSNSNTENKSEYDVHINSIEDIVLEKIKTLKQFTRYDLDLMLKNILIVSCNNLTMNSLVETSSEDLISIVIMKEAAKAYSLNPYSTPATLSETIADKYYAQFLNRLHKTLLNESPDQSKITDNNLQQYLNKASIEIKRDLNKKIKLNEFSGRGIGQLIRSQTGIKNIRVVIECLGLDAFNVLNNSILTIYDCVLGINKLSRAMIAQLVWVSVKAYGTKFTISNDLLPSYMPGNRKTERDNEESEFLRLLWQAYYYKFKFDRKIFESIMIDFTQVEILKIEEYLKEMHDCEDINSFGIKQVNDDQLNIFNCAVCMVAPSKNVNIVFDNLNIKEIRKI